MKKILSLFLALSLVFALMGCLPAGSMEAPVQPTLPEIVTEAPTEVTTEAPTQAVTEPATEAVTEETDPIDPRPHPADVQAEQDRLNAAQDRDEALRKEQEEQARQEQQTQPTTEAATEPDYPIDPDGYYTSKNDVALYIHVFGRLPGNYISKSDGNALYGSYKNIPSYMNIGGDHFQNREGRLPAGHTYYECDIGTSGGRNRGQLRIVFSTDGLVYYTSDHYNSFTLLYGEP